VILMSTHSRTSSICSVEWGWWSQSFQCFLGTWYPNVSCSCVLQWPSRQVIDKTSMQIRKLWLQTKCSLNPRQSLFLGAPSKIIRPFPTYWTQNTKTKIYPITGLGFSLTLHQRPICFGRPVEKLGHNSPVDTSIQQINFDSHITVVRID